MNLLKWPDLKMSPHLVKRYWSIPKTHLCWWESQTQITKFVLTRHKLVLRVQNPVANIANIIVWEKLENISYASVPFNSVCQNFSGLISGVMPKLWQSKPFVAKKDLCAPFFLSSQWSHLIAKNASNYPKCQTLPSFNLWGHTEFVC